MSHVMLHLFALVCCLAICCLAFEATGEIEEIDRHKLQWLPCKLNKTVSLYLYLVLNSVVRNNSS